MTAPSFERYLPLVGDEAAFLAALERPLPVTVWTNTTRTSPERLAALFAADGLAAVPLTWKAGAFRLGAELKPGLRFEYLAGLSYVQEEVSQLPVHLLDPQPGERVLDLCAAPGNKTAEIALRVGPQGTVIANDRHLDRVSLVRRNLGRLGLSNFATTVWDATSYPTAAGLFDRVLADVPCSCEGTSRKFPGLVDRPHPMPPGRLASLQTAILQKAVQLCRVGGRIVYSTCTFAPEENEAVVDRVLAAAGPARLELLPAQVPGFASSPGLTAWQGQGYLPALARTLRVWPHQNDTGGFFVAVLHKLGPSRGEPTDTTVAPPAEAAERWITWLEERHGLPPASFEGTTVTRPGRRLLGITNAALRLPVAPAPHTIGLPFLYCEMAQPRLASESAQLFGPWAERNLVVLARDEADAYFRRETLVLGDESGAAASTNGPVFVRHHGFTLGLAAYHLEEGRHELASLFPTELALAPGRSAFAGV